MPIYAYRCTECGHAQDVLQKISDPLLTQCPACGKDSYAKQVTAAGFQLKGSGWYVTDFRDGNKGAAKPTGDKPADEGGEKLAEKAAEKTADKPSDKAASQAESKSGDKPVDKSAAPAAAAPVAPPPPAAPAAGG